MAKRKSIYVGDALERVLAERDRGDSGFRSTSGVINAIADRYDEIVRRSMPRLTVNEWCLIWDALNGVWMQDTAGLYVRGVVLEVQDAIQMNDIGRKWDVDGKSLIEQLSGLSYCSFVAVVDAAERFWGYNIPEGQSLRDTVVAIVGEGCAEG